MTETQNIIYWSQCLVLADRLAAEYKIHRGAAINRCLKNLIADCSSPKLVELAGFLKKADDKTKIARVYALYSKLAIADELIVSLESPHY